MNISSTITVTLSGKHASLFHELLANYHSSPNAEAARLEEYLRRGREPPEKPLSEGTLYAYVQHKCTCGDCYRRFARSSRECWRGDGKGKFVNCRYKPVFIHDCPVKDFSGTGYIYDKTANFNNRINEDALISEQVSRDLDLDLKKEQVKAAQAKTQLILSNTKNKIKDAEGKRADELKEREDREKVKLATLQRKRDDAWKEYVTKVHKACDRIGGLDTWQFSKEKAQDDTFDNRMKFYGKPFVFYEQSILDTLRAKINKKNKTEAIANKQWTKVVAKSKPKKCKLNVNAIRKPEVKK